MFIPFEKSIISYRAGCNTNLPFLSSAIRLFTLPKPQETATHPQFNFSRKHRAKNLFLILKKSKLSQI